MRVSLTRTVTFHATHQYGKAGWSEAENRARFGATAARHGHEYRCTVRVSGPLDPDTSMIMDLGVLDRVLAEEVTGPFHGHHLNDALPAGAGLPTCEAVALHLFPRIAARLPAGVTLEAVRIAEDDTLHAECTGP